MTDPTSSTLVKRSQLSQKAGQHFGGDRDLYEVFGYPRTLTIDDFVAAYIRQDLAARIVDAFPDATWRESPAVVGDSGFQSAWEELEYKHQLWRTFHRLDRLTGMGHYGVMVLGLDGGEPMNTPTRRADYRLLYVQPHSERTAQITAWEDDPSSPRFGLPKTYRITTGVNWTGSGAGQKTVDVHHSRVLHVAERSLEDVSIGTPRLERVFNRLMDLEKLLGGSAEIFWQNAAMLRAFVADKDVEWEPDEQKAMQEQLEEMQHGLRRQLRLRGVETQQLAAPVPDPKEYVDKQLDAIAGATGVPKRILIGSERGELSSEQDENNWAARISERRVQYVGPTIIEAFVRRGAQLGFLPQGYEELDWPEEDTLGEKGRAEIADRRAGAIQKYSSTAGAELLVTPEEFREWLGLDAQAPVQDQDDLLDDEQDEEVVAMWSRRRG